MKDVKILRKFAQQVHSGFRPQLNLKLNKKEVELLVLLDNKPDMPMHECGRHLHLEKGSFTYVVDLLEAKGLILRTLDEEDKRKRTIKLTDLGKETFKEIHEQHEVYIENRLSVFSEEEITELNKAIETVERLAQKLPLVKPHKHGGPRHQQGHGRHQGKGHCGPGECGCESNKKD